MLIQLWTGGDGQVLDLLGWVVAIVLFVGVVVGAVYAGNRIWNRFYQYPGKDADKVTRLKALQRRTVVTLLAELITLPPLGVLVIVLDGPRIFVIMFLVVLTFSSAYTLAIIVATRRKMKSHSN
jgi:hypothetical protein